jgi:transposase
MRYKTLERYRKAAALLRKQGLVATPSALAKKLGVSPKHMHDMLNRWPELRTYAGIVRSRESKKERYDAIIRSLTERGMPVTASKVAEELDISLSSTYRYIARNVDAADTPITPRALALKDEYRRAVAAMRTAKNPLTRKSLAIELGKPLATVQQYLWSHPELCEELGIGYTNAGHQRLYQKKPKEES